MITFDTTKSKETPDWIATLGENFSSRFLCGAINLAGYQDGPAGPLCDEDISLMRAKAVESGVGGALFIEDTQVCFNAMAGLPGNL